MEVLGRQSCSAVPSGGFDGGSWREDRGNTEDDFDISSSGEWWWHLHNPGRGSRSLSRWKRQAIVSLGMDVLSSTYADLFI